MPIFEEQTQRGLNEQEWCCSTFEAIVCPHLIYKKTAALIVIQNHRIALFYNFTHENFLPKLRFYYLPHSRQNILHLFQEILYYFCKFNIIGYDCWMKPIRKYIFLSIGYFFQNKSIFIFKIIPNHIIRITCSK